MYSLNKTLTQTNPQKYKKNTYNEVKGFQLPNSENIKVFLY